MAIVGSEPDLGKMVCEALGLVPDMTKRVILDIDVGQPVRAYVEMYADERIFDIKWDSFSGATISTVDKEGA